MGDAGPEETVICIAGTTRSMQYMEHVLGFGIESATAFTLSEMRPDAPYYIHGNEKRIYAT
jgi:hypothetical protein